MIQRLVLRCKCGYLGNDYIIRQAKPPHDKAAFCPLCMEYIKHLPKEDKWNTKEQKSIAWEKTKGLCCYCGIPVNPFNGKMHIEHIIPRKEEVINHTDNLYISCNSCNCSKGAKSLEDYRIYCIEKQRITNQFYFEYKHETTR